MSRQTIDVNSRYLNKEPCHRRLEVQVGKEDYWARTVGMETNRVPRDPQEDSFFENYKPASWDGVTLPNHVVYLLLATAAVFLALCAIIRHLITDLIHDLADCLFGEQPPGVTVNPWECRDKFWVDWSPRAGAGGAGQGRPDPGRDGERSQPQTVPHLGHS